MPAALITSRIAAHTGTRQIEMLSLCDGIGERADAAVLSAWQKVVDVLDDLGREQPATVSASRLNTIRAAFAPLPAELHATIDNCFHDLAAAAYHKTTDILAKELPAQWLPAVARSAGPVAESRLLEAGFTMSIGGRGGVVDAGALANPGGMTADQKSTLYKQLLFPPAERPAIDRVVYSGNWQQRIGAMSKLTSPDVMAETVAKGWAAGKTPQQIAKDLMPEVSQVRSSARRIARTQGMDIANGMQLHGYEKLGDLCVGFQIHATLDQHTRPWHASRNGTIYYKLPQGNQLGLEAMPHPPREADGSMAFNCRCWVSPVLKPPDSITSNPQAMSALRAGSASLQPDQAVYSQWWLQASEKEKKMAIGAKLFRMTADVLKRPPNWEDVINPLTGQLLPIDQIQSETQAERFVRTGTLRALITDRERQLRDTLGFGFQAPAQTLFEPSSVPARFRGMVFAHPDVPASAIDRVAKAMKIVRASLAKELRVAGVRINLSPTTRHAMPDAEILHPRGYPDELSWAHARGHFNSTTNLVNVAHQYRRQQTNEYVSTADHDYVLLHELGHAYDAVLNDFRNTAAFQAAYQQDLLTQADTGRVPDAYFLQVGEAGRSETFAEMFNHLHLQKLRKQRGGLNPPEDVEFHQYFPAVAAVMKALLGM